MRGGGRGRGVCWERNYWLRKMTMESFSKTFLLQQVEAED